MAKIMVTYTQDQEFWSFMKSIDHDSEIAVEIIMRDFNTIYKNYKNLAPLGKENILKMLFGLHEVKTDRAKIEEYLDKINPFDRKSIDYFLREFDLTYDDIVLAIEARNKILGAGH